MVSEDTDNDNVGEELMASVPVALLAKDVNDTYTIEYAVARSK